MVGPSEYSSVCIVYNAGSIIWWIILYLIINKDKSVVGPKECRLKGDHILTVRCKTCKLDKQNVLPTWLPEDEGLWLWQGKESFWIQTVMHVERACFFISLGGIKCLSSYESPHFSCLWRFQCKIQRSASRGHTGWCGKHGKQQAGQARDGAMGENHPQAVSILTLSTAA